MVYLFKLLYTYQTIGKEIIKEKYFQKRIEILRLGKTTDWKDSITERDAALIEISSEIKDIVFDYFNIITKEYELSYEKWKNDTTYGVEIKSIKDQIDNDYINNKF